jgi:hypothetical protein
LRAAVLSSGARLLEKMLEGVGSGWRFETIRCVCGHSMASHGRDEKRIKTVLGDITFRRTRYVCPSCGASRFPGDEALNVVGTGFSPGLRRLMSRAGSKATFKEGRDDLKVYGEIIVSAKDVERVAEGVGQKVDEWSANERHQLIENIETPPKQKDIPLLYVSYDGTGVPMVPWELAGRKGKQPDGSSRTREVKLGCVFTQTKTDDKGRPVRDDASTTFVGAIEGCEEFGWRIYGEAVRRGLQKAIKVAVIGDGSKWIWNIADTHFSKSVQIVDLYHARQHLYSLCSLLFGETKLKTKYELKWLTTLDEGNAENIINEATQLLPKSGKRRKLAKKEISYFQNNINRMRYKTFREQDLFVGSGVVEAGCKTIVGMRLKQSGMEWTVLGANSIITLRCAHLSTRIEDFWEKRAA